MTKSITASLLPISLLLLTHAAQAQASFRLGPQVGFNSSSASYFNDSYHIKSRPGFEAGVLGSIDFGYISLQPALLFSQKGYYLTSGTGQATGMQDDKYRLNYITLPAKVVYSPRKDGQGIQFFAGAYLGLLVGGNYERAYTQATTTTVTAGPIVPNQSPLASNEYSSQRLDAGFIIGLGYRYKQAQLHADFTWGGPDLSVRYQFKGSNYANPFYRNQAVQVSLAYLLFSASKD
jgi:hypothetical protein